MKIAFLNVESELGGAERCLLDLLSSLPTQLEGAEPHFIELTRGPLGEKIRGLGIPVTTLPIPESLRTLGDSGLKSGSGFSNRLEITRGILGGARALLPFARRLRETLEKLEPDLIHSNGIKSHLLLALAGVKIPVVWHLHDFIGSRPLVSKLLRRASKHPACLIANSRAVAIDVEKIIERPVEWVHNGVDTEIFSPGEPSPAGKLASPHPGRLKVGLVATYAKWKGHSLFLEAIARLSREPLAAHVDYYLIGGPIYKTLGSQISRKELEEQAVKLKIADCITYVEFHESTTDVYRSLDIVVHASTEPEPFGRTIVEAMACGRAVIVAKAGGAAEIFRDEEDALGFEMGNVANLASAIRRLVGDTALRQRLASSARTTALTRFSKNKYVTGIVGNYRQAVLQKDGVSSKRSHPRLQHHDLVVATGYKEDNWRSSQIVAEGLVQGLRQQAAQFPQFSLPYLHSPSCHRTPRWFDRRLSYGNSLPSGNIFQLTDQSYGDALISARPRFDGLVALIIDIAFWLRRNPVNDLVRRRMVKGLALADVRVTMSHAMALEIERHLGLEVHAIIPPGIDLEKFPHSIDERDPFSLLHVGTTDERKGVDRAIRFLAGLPETYRLVHVGSPMTEAQWKLAVGLGVRERLSEHTDLGLPQLVRHYQRTSHLLLPSRYEGFGLPAIEARLCGTPVVLSASVPAIEQLQTDPGTLQIDFSAFDEKGTQFKRNEEYAKFLQFQPGVSVLQGRESFGWDRVAARYCEIYESLQSSRAVERRSRGY